MGFLDHILYPNGLPSEEEMEASRLRNIESERRSREEQAARYTEWLKTCPSYDLGDGRIGRSRRLRGRCRGPMDFGATLHIVPTEQGRYLGAGTESDLKALCGAKPARRSIGWSEIEADAADCARCLAKFEKMRAG